MRSSVGSFFLSLMLCSLPVHAAPAPPAAASMPTSKELAAQAPTLEGMYAYREILVQNVKEKHIDALQQHFEERLRDVEQGKITDSTVAFMFAMVGEVDEPDAGTFDLWTEAYPQSFIGPLARAAFNMHRAWSGRGNKMARNTLASEFAEMERWLPMVRRDAQLALQREPRCALCYAQLIELSMPLRLDKEALEWFNQGMAANGDSIAVPKAYFHALDSRWGGSEDEQAAMSEKLRLAGHERASRRLTAQLMADRIAYSRWSSPEQASEALAAALAALALADTYTGRNAQARALQYLERHAEAVDAFTSIVNEDNSPAELFEARSYSYAKLGRWPESVRDLRIAYDRFGSPWAFESLVKLRNGHWGRILT